PGGRADGAATRAAGGGKTTGGTAAPADRGGTIGVTPAGGMSARAGGTAVIDDRTSEPGLYRVAVTGGPAGSGQVRHLAFAVNAFAPARSAIAPRDELALAGSSSPPGPAGRAGPRSAARFGPGGSAGAGSGTGSGSGRSGTQLWPVLAALALGLLLGEWVVFHRA
ncbi:MAG: hypothetical protein ACRD0J_11375, partial [Acidimicrobiales bacterium]